MFFEQMPFEYMQMVSQTRASCTQSIMFALDTSHCKRKKCNKVKTSFTVHIHRLSLLTPKQRFISKQMNPCMFSEEMPFEYVLGYGIPNKCFFYRKNVSKLICYNNGGGLNLRLCHSNTNRYTFIKYEIFLININNKKFNK